MSSAHQARMLADGRHAAELLEPRVEQLRRVSAIRRASRRASVIAVTSGKGGVGKSQIALNCSVVLAEQGLKVLLVDADLGLATLDVLLGVRPVADLGEVVAGSASIEDVLISCGPNLTLLPAAPGRYDTANVGAAERARIRGYVEEVAMGFDVVLVDTGAGIGATTIDFVGFADDALIVLTPDPVALRDAYATAKILYRRLGLERVYTVANLVSSVDEGEALAQSFREITSRFLPVSVMNLGVIPTCQLLRDSTFAGAPHLTRQPDSHASRALRACARALPVRPRRVLAC